MCREKSKGIGWHALWHAKHILTVMSKNSIIMLCVGACFGVAQSHDWKYLSHAAGVTYVAVGFSYMRSVPAGHKFEKMAVSHFYLVAGFVLFKLTALLWLIVQH
jgi:hypothetical protein